MRTQILKRIIMGAVVLGLTMPAFASVVKKGGKLDNPVTKSLTAVVKKPGK